MTHIKSRVAVAAFAAVCSLLTPSLAQAVVVGPGDPIRTPMESNPVHGNRYVNSPMCSGGVAGTVTDRFGQSHRVMLTAGHCLLDYPAPGLPIVTGEVYVPTAQGDKHIGTAGAHRWEQPPQDIGLLALPAAVNGADYGVIVLDEDVQTTAASYSVDENGESHGEPVVMTGIKDYKDLPRGVVAIDNLGQPVCKDGSKSGRACGVQLFRARNGVWTAGLGIDHGDSGGNVYDPRTNEVIGVSSMAFGPVSRVQPADIALEEAYGIPDGEVNDHFQVSDSTAERDTAYRTTNEDLAANEAYYEQQGETSLGVQVSSLDDAVSIPSVESAAERLAEATSLVGVPALSDLPGLSGLADLSGLSGLPGSAE